MFQFLVILLSAIAGAQPKPPSPAEVAVAVMDFEGRGLPVDQAATLTDRFRAELGGCGGLRQVERSKMDEILREQGFQQSGCTSTECAVQTGRLLGVERMVSGSVARIGGTWTLQARLIDVGTAEILKTGIVDQRGPVDDLLTTGMALLAERLMGGCKAQVVGAKDSPRPGEVPVPAEVAAKPNSAPAPSDPSPDAILDTLELPIQLALFSPAASPAGSRVHGFAFDVFYGRLASLRGVQLGVTCTPDAGHNDQVGLCDD